MFDHFVESDVEIVQGRTDARSKNTSRPATFKVRARPCT